MFCLVMLCFDIITRSCCYDNIYINIAGVFRSFNMHIKFYDAQFVLQKQNYWRCCTRMYINDDLKVLKWVQNSVFVTVHLNSCGFPWKLCKKWWNRNKMLSRLDHENISRCSKNNKNIIQPSFQMKIMHKILVKTIIKMFIFILYHHHQ